MELAQAKAELETEQELWAARLPGDGAYRLGQLPGVLDLCLPRSKEQGICNVVTEGDDSLLLLAPGKTPEHLPAVAQEFMRELGGSFVLHRLTLGYEQLTYKQALSRLLPPWVSVPSGYEVVGHIAHFNLQEQHWPHRTLIGQICLEKRGVRTVVAKLGKVSNLFRTFEMEVIAGEADTYVRIQEHGLRLHFDFQEVALAGPKGSDRPIFRLLFACFFVCSGKFVLFPMGTHALMH